MGRNHSRNKNLKPHLKGPCCLPLSAALEVSGDEGGPESCLSSPLAPHPAPLKEKVHPSSVRHLKHFQLSEYSNSDRGGPAHRAQLVSQCPERHVGRRRSPHGSSGPVKTTGGRAGLQAGRKELWQARPSPPPCSKTDFSSFPVCHQPTHRRFF